MLFGEEKKKVLYDEETILGGSRKNNVRIVKLSPSERDGQIAQDQRWDWYGNT